MAEKKNRIAKAAVALAAAVLIEKGVEVASKAVKNRRARRKGTAVTKQVTQSAKGAAKAAGRKAAALGAAARKQVPAARKKTARYLAKLAKGIAP